MKKALLTLIFIVGISTISFAQNANIKYHGEVEAGYTLGVGDGKTDRINVRTINGIQIGECFSYGIGIGVDYYLIEDSNSMVIPVFANFKGYYPTGTNIKPYISMNLGCGFGVNEGLEKASGFLIEPALGVKIHRFKVEVGYSSQRMGGAESDYDRYSRSDDNGALCLNGLQLKIGVSF